MHSRLVAGGSLLLPNCRTAGAISIRRNIVHIDQEYPTRMYENRYVREHQRKRDETLPKDFYKKSTGLCGLYVSMQPHKELTEVLTRILHVLKLMPEDYEYRLNTEEIVQQRLSHTKNEPDIRKLEEKIGMGQVEELIEQATYELETARMLAYYKAWEPLVEQAEESQWRWPIGSGP